MLKRSSTQSKVSSRHCLERPFGHETFPVDGLDLWIPPIIQIRTEKCLAINPVVIEEADRALTELAFLGIMTD